MKKLLLILLCLPLIGFAQCVSGDCENGYGKFIWKNDKGWSMSYEGEWKDGLKHGIGVLSVNNKKVSSKYFQGIEIDDIIDYYSAYINKNYIGYNYSLMLNALDSLWLTLDSRTYYNAYIEDMKGYTNYSTIYGKLIDILMSSKELHEQEYLVIVEDEVELEDEIEIEDTESDEDIEIEIEEEDEEEFFMVVENMPKFCNYIMHDSITVIEQCGDLALMKYVQKNVRYPAIAKEYNITGKVYVSFIVDKKGSVTNVKIVRGVDEHLDAEAVRMIKSLPKYKPGRQRGVIVRVMYTIPINFTLN